MYVINIRTSGASASTWHGNNTSTGEIKSYGPFHSEAEAKDCLGKAGWEFDSLYGYETKIKVDRDDGGASITWTEAWITCLFNPRGLPEK